MTDVWIAVLTQTGIITAALVTATASTRAAATKIAERVARLEVVVEHLTAAVNRQ